MNYDNYYDYSFNQMNSDFLWNMAAEDNSSQMYNIYQYPDNLANALDLITQAVSGESEDREFYTYLLENAPSEEDRQIITGIRDNEINHFNMFHKIFYDLTGKIVQQQNQEQFVPPSTYCDGLRKAILGEQNAVAKYRQILFAMQSHYHFNMVMEIMTDEIRHGILYNYLFTKNGCSI